MRQWHPWHQACTLQSRLKKLMSTAIRISTPTMPHTSSHGAPLISLQGPEPGHAPATTSQCKLIANGSSCDWVPLYDRLWMPQSLTARTNSTSLPHSIRRADRGRYHCALMKRPSISNHYLVDGMLGALHHLAEVVEGDVVQIDSYGCRFRGI